jgi:protein-S-isoprenylcysteine O-methyltransferase Ste14
MMTEKAKRSPMARGMILLTASALVIVLALGALWLDGRLGIRLSVWLQWPGMVALACGLALIAWSEVTLLRIARSTGGFGDPPEALVTEGPYRYGAFAVLLGLSWWRNSPALFAIALGFLIFMSMFVRRVEEPATRRRLGEAYDDYLCRVPRWVPRIKS